MKTSECMVRPMQDRCFTNEMVAARVALDQGLSEDQAVKAVSQLVDDGPCPVVVGLAIIAMIVDQDDPPKTSKEVEIRRALMQA